MSVVLGFVRGLWRLLFSLVFLIGLMVVLGVGIGLWAAHRMAAAPIAVSSGTTLMIMPDGVITEDASGAGLSWSRVLHGSFQPRRQTSVLDMLTALDYGRDDPRLAQIVVDLDGASGLGWAQAQDLAAAIDRARSAGKTVIAYGHDYDQIRYLVAAHATTVVMDPDGAVMLTGLSSYRPYFKDALDRLGVSVHLFRVGAYKSAAEPYVLDSESAAAKDADSSWMGSVWSAALADMAAHRHLTAQQLADWVDHPDSALAAADNDTAQAALRAHLIDRLATPDALESWLADTGRYNAAKHKLVQVDAIDYAADINERLTERAGPHAPVVAVVPVVGELVDGEAQADQVDGDALAATLRRVRFLPRVKAVVLRVDSPGGSVVASETIRRQVEMLRRAGIPVVVSMGNVTASGGYWLSTAASALVAEPTTVTGSIGIFGMTTDVSKGLAAWGVRTDGVATSPAAAIWDNDPTRPFDPAAGAVLQGIMNHGYREFLGHVAAARGLTTDQVDAVAQGHVWSGSQALDRKLVDRLGGLDDAIALAREQAHAPNALVRLVSIDDEGFSGWMRSWRTAQAAPALPAQWSVVAPLLPVSVRDEAVFFWRTATSHRGPTARAVVHCLCAPPTT